MYPEALLFWISMLLVPNYMEGHLMKREVRCPVSDYTLKIKNDLCLKDEAYHCFEDEDYRVVTNGCFKPKVCREGSHPVQEGEVIVCALCQTGFQRQDNLKSTEYRVTYCNTHSRACDPEYGQSECRPATHERDRACTCNATLGFSPRFNSSECQCFTPDDACAGCNFTGCPYGSVRNERGFCVPGKSTTAVVTVSTPEQSTIPSSEGEHSHLTWIIVISILVLLAISGLVCLLCWRRRRAKQRDQRLASAEIQQQFSDQRLASAERQLQSNITNQYALSYVENLHINGQGPVGVDVQYTGGLILGAENNINMVSNNKKPSSSNGRTCAESPADTNLSNRQHPSETTESGQSPQPQEPADPSSPLDAAEAESPVATNNGEALPLLPTPTAPILPLDPSAPPPSLPFEDRGQVEEVGEDAGDTYVKTPLPTVSDDETQVKDPYTSHDLTDETEMKTRLLSDDEETERKTTFSSGDFGDAAPSDNTDLKTPLLSEPGTKAISFSKERNGLSHKDARPIAVATADSDEDIFIVRAH